MNNNLFNIKDYVVVITGGTGVLGRTIAKYLRSKVRRLPFWAEKKKWATPL